MKITYIIFALASIFIIGCSASGVPDSVAQCLTDNGATMYGTEWCPHCQQQKKSFGSSFKKIHYVDCDKFQNECSNAGVTGYPTWHVGGEVLTGAQSPARLADIVGCEFPAEEEN